jgi:hypothetical protein
MNAITPSIVTQIATAYKRFELAGTATAESIVEYVNAGREVGIYLATLKSHEPHYQQLMLLPESDSDHLDLPFDVLRAKMFERLPKRLEAPATSITDALSSVKDALMIQNVLPFPEERGGHGAQQLHEHDPVSAIIRHVMEAQAIYNKDVRDQMSEWTDERKQHLRDQLKPIVDIYDALAA